MRIGILAPPWLPVPPPAYGGTESVIDGLARGVAAAGHEVLLWTVGESTCTVPCASIYERARTAELGRATIEVRHVSEAYAAFARWGADIVHDHTTVGPLIAGRHACCPVVSTNHGPFDDEARALYRAVAPEIGLIAISSDQARRAPSGRVTATIHHGIDLDLWPPGDGGGDEDGEYVAFLGRMAPEKGVHVAAQVAARAGVRLKIAAKMRELPERQYFQTAVEPCLGPNITYIGELDRAGVAQLLRNARVLLNPIQWAEPFGLVMIEALACGTPVIAPAIGSVTEIVTDGVTGFVCSEPRQMVEAIDAVKDIDRAACRQSMLTDYSTERMVRDHLALYETLVVGERPAGDATNRAWELA